MWESKESEYRQLSQVFFLCKEENTAVVLVDMVVAQGHGLDGWMYVHM